MTSEKKTTLKDILPISLALTAAYSVSLSGLYLQPQLLIPLKEVYESSDTEIGRLYGAENFAFFITLLLTTIAITRFSRTKMALLGTLIFVLGTVPCGFAGSISSLMFYRVIVSIGAGIVSSAATAAASGSKDPVRAFALSGILYLSAIGVMRGLIPVGLINFGLKGVFVPWPYTA